MPVATARRSLAALALAFVPPGCGDGEPAARCGPSRGIVERVKDGDTVVLEGDVDVRYLLVDTPELGSTPECFGPEARDLNAELVLGREVALAYDVECEDRYDRLLAYVSLGDRMVNEVLVERGYAKVLVIAPNVEHVDRMRALEAQAQAAQRGLWGACP